LLQQEIILPPDEATNKVQSPGNIKNCPVGSGFLEFPCIPQKKDDWFLRYFLVPEKKRFFHRILDISYIQEIFYWFFFMVISIFLPLRYHEEEIALHCILALPDFIID
jgi:hypothetical protein